ncbi:unnamed protein product [Medioppia subpectinata]|uniref:Uncharacterized protein n=1 Tax=Medioppia subpectinata TaxID=1979941 RepID=A0A7R9KC43_9ACAR|nr:unnamed protein product [Medioppia subpectinata]CAG2100583.1 unnamed protein product [Medioppia subpectinata]
MKSQVCLLLYIVIAILSESAKSQFLSALLPNKLFNVFNTQNQRQSSSSNSQSSSMFSSMSSVDTVNNIPLISSIFSQNSLANGLGGILLNGNTNNLLKDGLQKILNTNKNSHDDFTQSSFQFNPFKQMLGFNEPIFEISSMFNQHQNQAQYAGDNQVLDLKNLISGIVSTTKMNSQLFDKTIEDIVLSNGSYVALNQSLKTSVSKINGNHKKNNKNINSNNGLTTRITTNRMASRGKHVMLLNPMPNHNTIKRRDSSTKSIQGLNLTMTTKLTPPSNTTSNVEIIENKIISTLADTKLKNVKYLFNKTKTNNRLITYIIKKKHMNKELNNATTTTTTTTTETTTTSTSTTTENLEMERKKIIDLADEWMARVKNVTKNVNSFGLKVNTLLSDTQLTALSDRKLLELKDLMRNFRLNRKPQEILNPQNMVKKLEDTAYSTIFTNNNANYSLIEAKTNDKDGSSNVEIFAETFGAENPKVYLVKDG